MQIALPVPDGVPDTPEVRAVLADYSLLLQAARSGRPQWSAPYGGPKGVAVLAVLIRDHLTSQAQQAASLRAVAIGELLRDQSLSAVGAALGISKQAVHKANRDALSGAFAPLLAEGLW